jgi:hypothetical protein
MRGATTDDNGIESKGIPMSLTSIEAHHRKWDALPAFPAWPYVMTDDDVQAWGDLLYMRGLVDAIEGACDDLMTSTSAIDRLWAEHVCDNPLRSFEFDVDVYLEPWPADEAENLLAAWREQDVAA